MGESIKGNLEIQSHTLIKICMSDGEIEQNDNNIWYQKIGYTDTVKCEKKTKDMLIEEAPNYATRNDDAIEYVLKSIEKVKKPCVVEQIAFAK